MDKPSEKKKIPLRIGFANDPFPPQEEKEKKSFQLLSLLNKYDYPSLIFTKSTFLGRKEYWELLHPEISQIQISLSSPYPELEKKIEPNAPSGKERLRTLEILLDQKRNCQLRINLLPQEFLIGHSYEKYLSDIFTLIEERKFPTIINEIIFQDSTNKQESILPIIKEWVHKLQIKNIHVSYCYLGSHPFNHYKFYGKEITNCCQFQGNTCGTKNISSLNLLALSPKPIKNLTRSFCHKIINVLGSQLYNEKSSP